MSGNGFIGVGVGETVEPKGKEPTEKEWLAAVGRAATNYHDKTGRQANALSLPTDVSEKIEAMLYQKGWSIVSKNQPKLHILAGEVAKWPKPGEWSGAKSDSHLAAVMWLDNNLYVQFKDDSLYRYDEVDHLTFRHLVAAPSWGTYLNDNIKEKFRHKKLEGDKAAEALAGKVEKPAPVQAEQGIFIDLAEPDKDFGAALEQAIRDGVNTLLDQNIEPNAVAVPKNTPGEIVRFLRDSEITVATWTPSKPNQVWVGVLSS